MVDFEKMYAGSWFTVIGAGGDIDEWKEGLQKMLDEENIGTIQEWAVYSGEDMNELGHLTDDNAYQDNLTFLSFSLDGLDAMKLAMFKIRFGARWFDDIVDNNAYRENYHPFDAEFYVEKDY